MIHCIVLLVLALPTLAIAAPGERRWPGPVSPAVPEADGYVAIPAAAMPPDRNHVYKAIFDATQFPPQPDRLLPALNMLGSELNVLAASGVPARKQRFAMVFHGAAIDGILDNAAYRAKFGHDNPNLAVLRRLKAAGVELFVCGQNLAFDRIDPATLVPEVSVASDALIVLITYQNRGYALLNF